MDSEHNIKLTASEVSQLWSAYMNSSLSNCIFTYFLEIVEDTQIRPLIEQGLILSQDHLQKLTSIFQNEGFPVPHGFKVEEDVNPSAPRLFSDSFVLYFIYDMGVTALNFYSLSKTLVARLDINAYFSERIPELTEFETMSKNVLLSKGLYIRAPYITPAKEVNFVQSNQFLAGLLGKKRPLTVIEITNLFANIQKNAFGRAVMMAFSQVAQSKEVGQFFVQGKEIAFKHSKEFATPLEENDLPVPMTSDSEVTDSKAAPFSDKMMMFMATALTALGIGYYATSMATSARKDLGVLYLRLSAEIVTYAEDGAKIMIKNQWLEEPPLSADRDKLANQ